MTKYEKLVEYIINDEDDKASAIFHDIVIEKSRNIYENIMEMEDDEIDSDMEEYDTEDMEADDMDDMDEYDSDTEMDLGDELGDDMEAEGDMEDRIVDLEDKLDELMDEFDELLAGESSDDMDYEGGMDDMDDMDDMDSDYEDGMDSDDDLEFNLDDDEPVEEDKYLPSKKYKSKMYDSVDLTPAPKPVTAEEGTVNTRGVNADNKGAEGVDGTVKVPSIAKKDEGNPTGPRSNSSKLLSNKPKPLAHGTTKPNPKPVAKPKTKGEDAGTNTKSVNL
jgi:hypothetical protein